MTFNTSLPVQRVAMAVAADDSAQDVVLVAKHINGAFSLDDAPANCVVQLNCGVDVSIQVPLATIDEWLLLQWS